MNRDHIGSNVGSGRDAGQRVPLGHRGQHPEGADQAAQYAAGCRQLRYIRLLLHPS